MERDSTWLTVNIDCNCHFHCHHLPLSHILNELCGLENKFVYLSIYVLERSLQDTRGLVFLPVFPVFIYSFQSYSTLF